MATCRARRIAVAALAALAAVVVACAPTPDDDTLFPLAAGHRWTYRVTTRLGDDPPDLETLVLSTLGRKNLPELDGEAAWHRRSDSGLDYWVEADASGIYRVASKSDTEPGVLPDRPRRFVLKAPYVVGTQWQAPTTAYLLNRSNDFPSEIRHTHPKVSMTYQIEALDEMVEAPAGRFEHCLRVRGLATVHLYADPASGWRDMPLTTLEWYCRGVGLVRVERSEPARTAFLSGGTRTLELMSWH